MEISTQTPAAPARTNRLCILSLVLALSVYVVGPLSLLDGRFWAPFSEAGGPADSSLFRRFMFAMISYVVVILLLAFVGLVTGIFGYRQARASAGNERGQGLGLAGAIISGVHLAGAVPGLAALVYMMANFSPFR